MKISTVNRTFDEMRRSRVKGCYQHAGGPLLGWLADEAKRRGDTGIAMSGALGVTAGYLHQLKSGHRQLAHISDIFANACARYLGVPPIVVKLLAGRVSIADFLHPSVSEDDAIERAFRSMLGDHAVRQLLPLDVDRLSADARKALVFLYAEVTHTDLFGVSELPIMLSYLQRAALVHDENLAMAEHRKALAA
jgi:hypothetical protein